MAMNKKSVLIGVDVGGTNTDAVVMEHEQVLGWHKAQTTDDVMSGVLRAIDGALLNATGESQWRLTSPIVSCPYFALRVS